MEIRIRRAVPADQRDIQRMVRRAGLNPVNVRWQNFVVADVAGPAPKPDSRRLIIGAGQLRPHRDGSRELASLVVAPDYRRRGVGGAIVRQLLSGQRGAVYLFCESGLESFYARFDFRCVPRQALPPPLARVHRLANLLASAGSALSRREMRIIAMRRDGTGA